MKKTSKIIPDLSYARETLMRYKREKRNFEARLESEGEIWRGLYCGGDMGSWIFNSVVNKHADVIESIPTCVCLPREKRDEHYAETLSKIIPVITQRCDFEQTYSDNSWEKLKHGTAVYGVFWNNSLEEGLGDIDIRPVAISDVFWEMGVSDVQNSKDLFIVKLCDKSELEATYGISSDEKIEGDAHLRAALGFGGDEKALVVDWYYKKYRSDGSRVLHFCKFVGDRVLYSSENDAAASDGWYSHGQYPVVFDRFYPTGSAYGFGLISISREIQGYINRIDKDMINYTDWASKVRFWAKRSLGVNEKEFLDLGRSIVEVEGDIDEEKLRQIEINPIDDSVVEAKRLKIEELKEVTGSRDVSQGGYSGSVTAASAISILREAGAKSSRDGIEETFRAYIKIISMVIELIRQFYTEKRIFRIVGEDGKSEYLDFCGRELTESDGRRPHFDIEVTATKKSPSESAQKNEFAKALYDAGAFKSENAKETLLMLELMDFEGVGNLKSAIRKSYLSVEDSKSK